MELKKLCGIIGVTIMSISLISSCTSERTKLAEDMLYKKYNEKFKIESVGNSIFMGNDSRFTAICHPEDNNILFSAQVYNDGSKIYDKYKEALLGDEMKKIIEQYISAISDDYAALIDFNSIADDYEKGISAYSYNNSHDTRCYTVLVIDVDKSKNFTPEQLYSALQTIYKKFGKTSGGLNLYLVDSDGLQEIRSYMYKNPDIDSTLLDACGKGFECTVTDGNLDKDVQEMTKSLY